MFFGSNENKKICFRDYLTFSTFWNGMMESSKNQVFSFVFTFRKKVQGFLIFITHMLFCCMPICRMLFCCMLISLSCLFAVCLFGECFFAVCLFLLAAFLLYAFLLNAYVLYAFLLNAFLLNALLQLSHYFIFTSVNIG